MSVASYTTLTGVLNSWLKVSGSTTFHEDLIELVESDLNTRLRLNVMLKRYTATMPTSDHYIVLPDDFLEMKRLQLNTDPLHTLRYLPPYQINSYYNTVAGKPDFYTVNGTELEFNRISDSAYTIEGNYYKKLTPVTSGNATNAIITRYPDLYLYGCLSHGATYVQDMELQALAMQRYEKAMQDAIRSDKRGQYNGSPLQMRTDTYNP